MTTVSPTQESRFKLGASPYWLVFTPETFGLTSGWRMTISYVAPRARKSRVDLPLLDVTPRKPLLSIVLGGETFPTYITGWEKKRGTMFTITGERRLGAEGRTASWSADLDLTVIEKRVQLDIQFRVNITPKTTTPVRLHMTLPIAFSDALVASSEIAQVREDRAMVAWDLESHNAVTFVAPFEAMPGELWSDDGEFRATFTEHVVGARKKFDVSLSFGQAENGPAVKKLLLDHYVAARPVILPPEAEWGLTLCQTAAQAVIAHTDKGAYDIRGVERAYFLPPDEIDVPSRRANEFYAAYPHFPVDASRALMAWHRFSGDHPVSRVAQITARGIAQDFGTTMSTDFAGSNKGAFWDKLTVPGGPHSGIFSGHDDEPAYSVLGNARIARAMFDIHAITNEHIFSTMALNACRWLLLRQNATGYFNGDRYRTSGEWSGGIGLAGVEVIPAMVGAFRATRNEVFIRAAWRIANHVMDEILPHHPCPSILPMERGAPVDSAVALAAVVRCLLHLDAEAPNKKLREAIQHAGDRLKCYPFNRMRDPEFDYDGQWGGLHECAQAMFGLYILKRNPEDLRLAISLLRAVPPSARRGWRSISGYFSAMISLAASIKDVEVNLAALSVKHGWRTYASDSATRNYMTVESADGPAHVDHLALVCPGDDHSMVMVMSDAPIDAVEIIKNQRRPVVTDLVSKQLVIGNAPMHKFPFASAWRYGVFTIAK